MFGVEFENVAQGLMHHHHDQGVIWQKDINFFKWRLFVKAFAPMDEGSKIEKNKLIMMALQMFMTINNRESPAHTSDTKASLLMELKAFLKSVAMPGRDFIV